MLFTFLQSCKLIKIFNKINKLRNSTKSQDHQPPQFSSWAAHQPPKIIENNKLKKIFIIFIFINFLFKNIKINK